MLPGRLKYDSRRDTASSPRPASRRPRSLWRSRASWSASSGPSLGWLSRSSPDGGTAGKQGGETLIKEQSSTAERQDEEEGEPSIRV